MSPRRYTFIFSTARPLRPRSSALSSLPHPPNCSPSPILKPTGTSTLSLTSHATSRPLSRPYCRDHSPQNTDSDFFLIARGGTGRQRRHKTSTRRTFWVSLVLYTRPHNFHVTINSLKHPFDLLTSRKPTSPMAVFLSIAIPSPIAVMRSTATLPGLTFLIPKPVSLVVDNKLYYPDVHTTAPSTTPLRLSPSYAAPLRSATPSP